MVWCSPKSVLRLHPRWPDPCVGVTRFKTMWVHGGSGCGSGCGCFVQGVWEGWGCSLQSGGCRVGFCRHLQPQSMAERWPQRLPSTGNPGGVWVRSCATGSCPRVLGSAQGCDLRRGDGAGAALHLPFACSAKAKANIFWHSEHLLPRAMSAGYRARVRAPPRTPLPWFKAGALLTLACFS